jgi:hypothetical protein
MQPERQLEGFQRAFANRPYCLPRNPLVYFQRQGRGGKVLGGSGTDYVGVEIVWGDRECSMNDGSKTVHFHSCNVTRILRNNNDFSINYNVGF